MADVTGPISTLPGSSHALPKHAKCDLHPDRPAVARIQGETDSFGSEMNDMCAGCLEAYRASLRSPEAATRRHGRCDWCGRDATDLRDARDFEEGMSGRLYRVCGGCIKRQNEELEAELAEHDAEFDYGDDE